MSSPSPPPRCAICLDDVYTAARPAFRTECDHAFHRPCILDLVLHDLSAAGNHVLAEKFAGADDELHAAADSADLSSVTTQRARAATAVFHRITCKRGHHRPAVTKC